MRAELPLVSIVTPSLNQGSFIEEAILSIKNQDYDNIEHIIVDGGSTDSTLDVIRRYQGTYNMRWTSEPDTGMYDAINKGLRTAHGEILAYLNADDLYLPWTVSVVVEYLNQHKEVEFIYGDLITMDHETQKNTLRFYPDYRLSVLIRRGVLGQPTVFFRKSVVTKVGLFDESLKFVGDCEYWMRAGKRCTFSKIGEFLAISRDHRMTLRERNRQEVLDELEDVRARHGAPKRSEKGFTRPLRWLHSIRAWSERCMVVKFLFYYHIRRGRPFVTSGRPYPWQRLIGSRALEVVSWRNLVMTTIPWRYRKRQGNWFVLDMEKEANESSTEAR